MDNLVRKDDIFVVLVRRFERYSMDGSYLIEYTLPKTEKYRKVIAVDGKYIDIYTGDEIKKVEYDGDMVCSDVELNANYLGGILLKPIEKGITISNEDEEAAQNTLDYLVLVKELENSGKIVQFNRNRK